MIYCHLSFVIRWWQGLIIEKKAQPHDEITSPLAGIDIPPESARSLASTIDKISGSAGGVHLLNFAYISLDSDKLLGSGSFSKVYRYRLRF